MERGHQFALTFVDAWFMATPVSPMDHAAAWEDPKMTEWSDEVCCDRQQSVRVLKFPVVRLGKNNKGDVAGAWFLSTRLKRLQEDEFRHLQDPPHLEFIFILPEESALTASSLTRVVGMSNLRRMMDPW